jgi:hypothetical protein
MHIMLASFIMVHLSRHPQGRSADKTDTKYPPWIPVSLPLTLTRSNLYMVSIQCDDEGIDIWSG